MDDFGAGYSSLNSLKDMPLDVLKLDADFFRGENEGGRGEIVVSEAIRLAKALNMRTVAEGVEVRDQVDFLAKLDCDMIQGYYYAKPMAGADYELRMGLKSDENLSPSVLSLTDSATDVVAADDEVVADDETVTDDVTVEIAEAPVDTTETPMDVATNAVDSVDIESFTEDATPNTEVMEENVEDIVETATEVSVEEIDDTVSEGINEMTSDVIGELVAESEETKAEETEETMASP